jgi:hypothetical protein
MAKLQNFHKTGVDAAWQHAGRLASHIHFVVDDLTRFKTSQTDSGSSVRSDGNSLLAGGIQHATLQPAQLRI